MKFWRKRKKNIKQLSGFLKAMLKPVILSLLPLIDGMIETWKLELLEKAEKVDPKKLIGFLSDGIDELREKLKDAIKKGLDKN